MGKLEHRQLPLVLRVLLTHTPYLQDQLRLEGQRVLAILVLSRTAAEVAAAEAALVERATLVLKVAHQCQAVRVAQARRVLLRRVQVLPVLPVLPAWVVVVVAAAQAAAVQLLRPTAQQAAQAAQAATGQ